MTLKTAVPKPKSRAKKTVRPIPRRKPVNKINKKRKASAFARCYGSKERVEWVKSLGCNVCGLRPAENAHTVTDGMGRKAGYETIIPLCNYHHRRYDAHEVWKDLRQMLKDEAAYVERGWQQFQKSQQEKAA